MFLSVLKICIFSFLLGNQVGSLQAKQPQEKIKYDCPPEFSKYLLAEKIMLKEKQEKLEAKEKELLLLEKKINEQMTKLKELEIIIENKLKEIRVINTERFQLLLKAISTMSPRKAAGILLNMDQKEAIKILSKLKSSQVASILSAMPPEKAAVFSQALSGGSQ